MVLSWGLVSYTTHRKLELNVLFLLDVDGVICNFIDGLIKSHGWGLVHDDFASWSHHNTLGVSDAEMWSVTNEDGWWLGLDEYPWAHRLVDGLRERGDVIFCTSPSLDYKCPSQKVRWLREHGFMDERKNDYQIGPRKDLNAKSGAMLIDDSDSNTEKYAESGGFAILFPQPWNEARVNIEDRVEYILRYVDMLIAWSEA